MKAKTRTPVRFLAVGSLVAMLATQLMATDRYPAAPKSDVVDDYHGTKVADPYRPLEDPGAPESRKWIEAENGVTAQFLDGIPQREAIRKRLTALWDYEKFRVPEVEAGRVFFGRN